MPLRAIIFIVLTCLLPSRSSADWNAVSNWEPFTFQLYCNEWEDDSSYESFPTACWHSNFKRRLEWLLADTFDDLRVFGLQHPVGFGPVVNTEGVGRHIYVFKDKEFYENENRPELERRPINRVASHASTNCASGVRNAISVSSDYFYDAANPRFSEPLAKYAFAHEFAHAVQASRRATHDPSRPAYDRYGLVTFVDQDGDPISGCRPPYWVLEGMADAIGITLSRRSYPAYWPPSPQFSAGTSWVGLRRYDWPLHYAGMRQREQYRSSAFWRHLSEVYMNGDLAFMIEWLDTMPTRLLSGDDDWLAWLDERLKETPRIGAGLSDIYPGFLTAFAAQWDRGDARRFGRANYERLSLGGCEQITLGNDVVQAPPVMLDIAHMAGKCLTITIEGLEPGQLRTVKVTAEEIEGTPRGSDSVYDNLWLGVVRMTGPLASNCARTARRSYIGALECLLSPKTFPAASKRAWEGIPIEADASGEVEVTLMLSFVPVEPTEFQYPRSSRNIARVEVAAGLEAAQGTIDGSSGDEGEPPGWRKRTLGALGAQPLEGDFKNFATTGHVGGGLAMVLGEELAADVAVLNQAVREMTQGAWGGLGGEQAHNLFRIGEAVLRPQSAPDKLPVYSVEIERMFQIFLLEPLPIGVIGNFPGQIAGSTSDNQTVYFSREPATVSVIQNSQDVFVATVSGVVCEIRLVAILAANGGCPRELQVEGRIAKPFAFLYRDETALVSVLTPGQAAFEQSRENAVTRLLAVTGGADGSIPPMASGGDASSGSICTCTCALPRPAWCARQCEARWNMCHE